MLRANWKYKILKVFSLPPKLALQRIIEGDEAHSSTIKRVEIMTRTTQIVTLNEDL